MGAHAGGEQAEPGAGDDTGFIDPEKSHAGQHSSQLPEPVMGPVEGTGGIDAIDRTIGLDISNLLQGYLAELPAAKQAQDGRVGVRNQVHGGKLKSTGTGKGTITQTRPFPT